MFKYVACEFFLEDSQSELIVTVDKNVNVTTIAGNTVCKARQHVVVRSAIIKD